jgi:hypothetical protein
MSEILTGVYGTGVLVIREGALKTVMKMAFGLTLDHISLPGGQLQTEK